jgi:hypothetical protein
MPQECPAGVDINDECEEVTASIVLIFQPTEPDPEAVSATFQENLESAIFAGELQELLACTEVYVLDQSVLGTPAPTDTDRNVSGGGIAAAVIGSMALFGIIAFLISRTSKDKEDLEELAVAPKEVPFDDGEDGSGELKVPSTAVKATSSLGAVKMGKLKNVVDDVHVVDTMSNPDDASSSNAGSSGWSSSAGVSSMNTGSAEGVELDKPGAIDHALAKLEERNIPGEMTQPGEDTPSIPSVTRADLDAAIEQGDWAAGTSRY